MNDCIEELIGNAVTCFDLDMDGSMEPEEFGQWVRVDDISKVAELIVRKCADYADAAREADCKFVGDYVAEAMGYGAVEGVATWRAK